MSRSAVYGGSPHIGRSSRSRSSSRSRRPRSASASSAMVTPGCARIHGTSASTRCSRGPTSGRGLTAASRPRSTASSHVDHVGAQLGRDEHLGVVEQVEHPRAERGAVDDRRARRRPRRRRRRSTHRLLAELRRRPSRPGARRPARGRRPAGPRRRSAGRRARSRRGRRPAGGVEGARRARARASPSMRSTRNARGASRSRSWPTTYQCPNRSTTPYGSRRRGVAPVRERHRRAWRLTASNSTARPGVTVELGERAVGALPRRARRAWRSALAAVVALEPHRGDREVERGELARR